MKSTEHKTKNIVTDGENLLLLNFFCPFNRHIESGSPLVYRVFHSKPFQSIVIYHGAKTKHKLENNAYFYHAHIILIKLNAIAKGTKIESN